MTSVSVRGAWASYGDVTVLRGLDLAVATGDVTAVLGPSGCGKTTLLRVLAGFHHLDAGEVRIADRVVAGAGIHVRPERRRVAVVPQEGTLFPHLRVAGNVGFGLRGQDGVGPRIAEMLELVGLRGEADRFPHELSGGQQQRVALARALAPRPAFVLLDEPFSSLDARLREQLRSDVRALLEAEGATAVVVTHDQREALSLADSLAVMRDGLVRQHGSPREVYSHPRDAWVARLLGDAVVLPLLSPSDGRIARTELGEIGVSGPPSAGSVLIRPEQLRVQQQAGSSTVAALVESVDFQGADTVLTVRTGAGAPPLLVRTRSDAVGRGAEVHLAVEGTGRLLEPDLTAPED